VSRQRNNLAERSVKRPLVVLAEDHIRSSQRNGSADSMDEVANDGIKPETGTIVMDNPSASDIYY